jgi:hypothetical protein
MQPLHSDILSLIRVASGDFSCIDVFPKSFARDPAKCQKLASYYIQNVMFIPDASPQRLIGLRPSDDKTKLKEHKRWLLKWLHPDRNSSERDQAFFHRIVDAAKILEEKLSQDEKVEPDARPLVKDSSRQGFKEAGLGARGHRNRTPRRVQPMHLHSGVTATRQAKKNLLPRIKKRLLQLAGLAGFLLIGTVLRNLYGSETELSLVKLWEMLHSYWKAMLH